MEREEEDEAEIEKYLPGVRKKLEWLSEEDLLKRVLSLEFNRLLKYYQNLPDIDLNAGDDKSKDKTRAKREKRDKDRRDAEEGYERLMVNVGKAEGFFPGNLMELVNRNVVGSKPAIGRIDLLPDYTLFDVRKEDAHRVIDALRNADFFGNRLRAEIASDRDYAGDARKSKGKRKDSSKKQRDSSVAKSKSGERKPKKAKKEKSKKSGDKPKYNGNFDIFMKKK